MFARKGLQPAPLKARAHPNPKRKTVQRKGRHTQVKKNALTNTKNKAQTRLQASMGGHGRLTGKLKKEKNRTQNRQQQENKYLESTVVTATIAKDMGIQS